MFADRIKTLAYRSGIKINEVSNRQAKLSFSFDNNGKRTTRNCFVTPFKDGTYWEFDCLSPIQDTMMSEAVCKFLLKENAKHFRGFWCIENVGGDNVLVYMHNVASELLTPDEFAATCWDVTRRVDEFMRVFT